MKRGAATTRARGANMNAINNQPTEAEQASLKIVEAWNNLPTEIKSRLVKISGDKHEAFALFAEYILSGAFKK
jgi:hypothetical protein